MSDKDGGPAFPVPETDTNYFDGGMTLRQWYAGQALAGIDVNGNRPNDLAKELFRVADAMIAEGGS